MAVMKSAAAVEMPAASARISPGVSTAVGQRQRNTGIGQQRLRGAQRQE